MAAWELWGRAMIPSLLSWDGTWVGATCKEEDRCNKIQDLFWRVMLRVTESCPRVALREEIGIIGMRQRI